MADIVDRLREFSGPRYPDDICGKACMGDAANEIERLRAGLMKAMQYENKCDQTGKPCSDACGCRLEAEDWCEDLIVGDPGRT